MLPGGRLGLHTQHATGTIGGFIGLLADRSSQQASLEELNGAAASGWDGLPGAGSKACRSQPTPMGWCVPFTLVSADPALARCAETLGLPLQLIN